MLRELFGVSRMKVALICPSNIQFMPYVDNYLSAFKDIELDYEVINWDRFGTEMENNNTYRDSKVGLRRNFFDYYKYKKFIVNKLNSNEYNRIIVFGLQLSFFLKSFLQKKFKGKYIIDIRDYNKIRKIFFMGKLINGAEFVVLSSLGFKEWLPESNKYLINHNTRISSYNVLSTKQNQLVNNSKVSIVYIGALRDYDINARLISELSKSERFSLIYHGEGVINGELQKFIWKNQIDNARLTGRYSRDSEMKLYEKSDLINLLIPNTDMNSRTLLTNRLYYAVIYGKPVLSLTGTYQATIVRKYNLGIVVDDFSKLESKILHYINQLDNEYEVGRQSFLEDVITENDIFYKSLIEFVSSSY